MGGKNQAGQGYKPHDSGRWRGFPIALFVGSASPHEVRLVEDTRECRPVGEKPLRLIVDRAYDSDPLDEKLAEQGVVLIAPHKSNRKMPNTQDGRVLRRYRRRWKVERLFAWLQNYCHILVRYDRFPANYLAFAHLACIMIFIRNYFCDGFKYARCKGNYNSGDIFTIILREPPHQCLYGNHQFK